MSRTFSNRTLRRLALAAGFLASGLLLPRRAREPGAQEVPAPPPKPAAAAVAVAAPAQSSLELLLDRFSAAHVTSPLADEKPLAPVVVDLDAAPPETTVPAGADDPAVRRVWRLPLPVRRDEAAVADPPALLDPAGKAAGTDVQFEVVPARRDVAFAELPVFADRAKKRSPEGDRYVVVDAPLEATFEIARSGAPLHCVFVAKRFGAAAPDDADPPSPELTITVDGEPVGELMVLVEDRAIFDLAPKFGASRVTVKVAGAMQSFEVSLDRKSVV
jgi:hypothetical protein